MDIFFNVYELKERPTRRLLRIAHCEAKKLSMAFYQGFLVVASVVELRGFQRNKVPSGERKWMKYLECLSCDKERLFILRSVEERVKRPHMEVLFRIDML